MADRIQRQVDSLRLRLKVKHPDHIVRVTRSNLDPRYVFVDWQVVKSPVEMDMRIERVPDTADGMQALEGSLSDRITRGRRG